MNAKHFVVLFASLSIGILFTYAAVTKLMDYSNFRFGISESAFISPFASILVWMIPVIELAIVLLLILPLTRLAGLYASFGLMLLFTFYIAVMLLSSSEIPCSCGGVLEEMSWPVHLVFNALFVVLTAIGIILERQRKQSTHSANLRNFTYAKRYPATTDTH